MAGKFIAISGGYYSCYRRTARSIVCFYTSIRRVAQCADVFYFCGKPGGGTLRTGCDGPPTAAGPDDGAVLLLWIGRCVGARDAPRDAIGGGGRDI